MTAASNFDPQAKGAAAGDKSNPPEGTRPRSSEPEQAATPLSQAGNPAPEAADATADQPHAAERGVDIAASRQADPAAAHRHSALVETHPHRQISGRPNRLQNGHRR